jgi:hypothetical protein
MEYLLSDLSVWWHLKLDVSLPAIIIVATLMSAATLVAYFISFIICMGIKLKTALV